jgi:hypothetical protein
MIRLAEFILKNYKGKIVEIGVGNYFEVSKFLAERGIEIIVTDVKPREIEEVEFVLDDVTNPDIEIYKNSSLIYSIRPPFELFEDIKSLARRIGADCIIKPLYGEEPDGMLINYKGLSFYIWRYSKK